MLALASCYEEWRGGFAKEHNDPNRFPGLVRPMAAGCRGRRITYGMYCIQLVGNGLTILALLEAEHRAGFVWGTENRKVPVRSPDRRRQSPKGLEDAPDPPP